MCMQVEVSHTGDRLRMSRRCQQSAQEPGGSLQYKYLNTHYRNAEVQRGRLDVRDISEGLCVSRSGMPSALLRAAKS